MSAICNQTRLKKQQQKCWKLVPISVEKTISVWWIVQLDAKEGVWCHNQDDACVSMQGYKQRDITYTVVFLTT